jgi:glutamate-1-semialdehyde 2,1-aminomutase
MFTLFFHDTPMTNYSIASKCDTQRFARYFWGMIERGIYFPCSQFEANFVSTAHTPDEIDATIRAARDVFKSIA